MQSGNGTGSNIEQSHSQILKFSLHKREEHGNETLQTFAASCVSVIEFLCIVFPFAGNPNMVSSATDLCQVSVVLFSQLCEQG